MTRGTPWWYITWLFTVWGLTFGILETYWTLAEAAQPGQQYADPLLPCLLLASLPTTVALSVLRLVASVTRSG